MSCRRFFGLVLGFVVLLGFAFEGFALEGDEAEIYMTRSGRVAFFSSTPLEDIEAVNTSVTSILKTETGELAFKIFMKSFEFERAAMQEHFNKDYIHSDEFPKSTFEGKILGIENIDLSADGVHDVEVEGELTIHGISQEVNMEGSLGIKKGAIVLVSKFSVSLSDYNVKVPTNFVKNISQEIEVSVNVMLEPYER